jgi:hypothetical protein
MTKLKKKLTNKSKIKNKNQENKDQILKKYKKIKIMDIRMKLNKN